MNIFEKEIMRRVKELDCSAVYRERGDCVSVIFDGEIIAEIRDKKIEKIVDLGEQESEIFLRIRRLCANVSNYCSAYEKGEPINIPDFLDGYRIIYSIGNAKMAARYDRKSGFEFVVWSGDENPEFFINYDKAREKFAVISGLVDCEKIFDDEEIEGLYYCVYVALEFSDALNEDMTELLLNLKNKLDIAISNNLSAKGGDSNAV